MTSPVKRKMKMRKCKIDRALDELNAARGKKYPDIGYVYYADIKGNGGVSRRSIWHVIYQNGGVTRSELNKAYSRATLAAIISTIKGLQA
jgi:hypothetical protein